MWTPDTNFIDFTQRASELNNATTIVLLSYSVIAQLD